MMKKMVSLLLALAMVVSLAACGGKSPETPKTAELCRGTVEDNTYTSEFLHVTLTLDDSWQIADDEAMAELSGLVADSFSDESVKNQLEKGGVVYDLYAMRSDGASLNIAIQKLGLANGAMMTEDAFAEANMKQLPDVLASSSIKVIDIQKSTFPFAGTEHVSLILTGSVQDVPLYETMVVVKTGSYVSLITAATFQNDGTAELLDLFQAR